MLSRFLNPRGDLTRGDDPFGNLQREIGRAVEDIQAIITARMDETERSTDDEIEKAMSRPQSWFREPPGTYTADIAQARQIRRAADYVRSRPVTHIDQDRFRADLNRAAGGWFE